MPYILAKSQISMSVKTFLFVSTWYGYLFFNNLRSEVKSWCGSWSCSNSCKVVSLLVLLSLLHKFWLVAWVSVILDGAMCSFQHNFWTAKTPDSFPNFHSYPEKRDDCSLNQLSDVTSLIFFWFFCFLLATL